MFIDDTIAAVATAPGEAGIGIVRLSGPKALDIANKIFKPIKGNTDLSMQVRKLVYGHVYDQDKVIDEVLVSYMKKPHTFTREDVVEINCHGGYISVRKILEAVIRNGARLADRGEFTKRAFLNGRIDLAQAESVMDLISAKTKKGFDLAINQLEGFLSKKIKEIRNQLIATMAQIEVSIDYPEEDIEEITYAEIKSNLISVNNNIDKLLLN